MDNKTTHRERIEKVLCGEKPDRIPISFWRHFPVDDQTPEGLAAATLDFQKKYDFDLVKVTPASSYCLKDWGAKDKWNGDLEGTRDYISPVISNPDDFAQFKLLNPREGFLGQQLECLKIIRHELPDSIPIIQTIFSPLAQIKNLIGRSNVGLYIRLFPQQIIHILKVICESTINFINECKLIKIDGIFYAVQQAQFDLLTEEEFLRFGKYFDIKVLRNLDNFWFNLLHIHGSNIMFNLLLDYPLQVINWHDRETKPDLIGAMKITQKILCGGLSRINSMVLGDSNIIEKEAKDALEQTSGKKFILGTGCVLPITTPMGNIAAARSFVEKY
jgi:uroporphyrinogen decarboxylase